MFFLHLYSSYELDVMEAQAKDSEDEAQNIDTKQHKEKGNFSISKSLSAGEREENLEQIPLQKGTPSRCVEVPGSFDNETAGKICSGMSLNLLDKTPLPENFRSELTSASNSIKKSPLSNASKLNVLSYSRKTPRNANLLLEHMQTESNAPVGDLVQLRVSNCLNLSFSKMEEDGTVSNGVKSPLKEGFSFQGDGQSVTLPENRKVAISSGSSKLLRTNHNMDFISEGALVVERTEESAPKPLMSELLGMNSCHSPEKDSSSVDNNTDLNRTPHCPANVLDAVIPEIRPQISSEKRKSIQPDRKPEAADVCSNNPESAVNDSSEPQNTLQDKSPSPATNVVDVAKSNTTVGSEFPGGDASTRSKPLRRKLLAKKTLGSRPSFGRGKALNQKGSIYVNKNISPKSSATNSLGQNETKNQERFVSPESNKVVSSTFNAEMNKDVKMASLLESGNGETIVRGLEDDETEALQDENGVGAMVDKETCGDIDVPNSVNTRTGEKVGAQNIQTNENIVGMEDRFVPFGGDNLIIEAENASSGNRTEQSKSIFGDNAEEEKIMRGKKRPLTSTEKKNLTMAPKLGKSKEGDRRQGDKMELSNKKAKTTNAKGSSVVVDRDMTPASVDMTNNSTEMEKENRPVHAGRINVNRIKQKVGKSTRRSNVKPLKSDGADAGSESVGRILRVKTEPVWFILSGHKLQRKEFQKVIRCLEGRVCRDSHQWSYQATHFIVPDPIRRTEKFFAAAAAGRYGLNLLCFTVELVSNFRSLTLYVKEGSLLI